MLLKLTKKLLERSIYVCNVFEFEKKINFKAQIIFLMQLPGNYFKNEISLHKKYINDRSKPDFEI